MGLKEFFQKRREKKLKSTIERLTKKLLNPYGQKAERQRIIAILKDIEDEDAYRGLLKRYTYVSEKNTIIDEEEKQQIYDILVAKGERVIPAIIDYLKTETMIFWPLKILRAIKGDKEAVTILLDIIDEMPDEYTSRNFERKVQLINNLRDFKDERILKKLLEWVNSEEEEIRFHAIDGLLNYPTKEVLNILVDKLVDEEETVRIKNFILEQFIMNRWSVKKHRKKLKDKIPEGYWIDDTGIIQRK